MAKNNRPICIRCGVATVGDTGIVTKLCDSCFDAVYSELSVDKTPKKSRFKFSLFN
jgi:NMD protein affecting ribosome stability and mRNA decay